MRGLAAFCLMLLIADPGLAKDEKAIFTASLENDYFAGQDNGYTNGVRFSYLSAERDIPQPVVDFAHTVVPDLFLSDTYLRFGGSFGQSMFTPDDISTKTPDPTDRPYAGWTYVTAGLLADDKKHVSNLQFTFGLVGPASLADGTQDLVHHLKGSPDPQGWDHQLKNEPGFILSYDYQWRDPFRLNSRWFEFTPHAGGSVGNVFTHLSIGGMFRVGNDLTADYGPPTIRPSMPGSDFFEPHDTYSAYLFAGFEGRAVARNIFLDGNTFEDSPRVDRKHLVGSLQLGAAVVVEDIRIAYTHVLRSREFHSQKEHDEFGAITVSTRF